MRAAIVEALIDSARMVPFLLVVYWLVERVEGRLSGTIDSALRGARRTGPLMGAVFGCIPQCGFSVLASALYARRMVTTGTLLSVLLATSDEAVPVILAQPAKAFLIVPLLLSKLAIGTVSGYAVDLLCPRRADHDDTASGAEQGEVHSKGCCDHNVSGERGKWEWLTHPLVHTAKVFGFLFVVTLALNYVISAVGPDSLGSALLQRSPLQPILCSLVGLIPNCAASVAITQVYLSGGLSFGSAIAGLCASGGLGILVLLRENGHGADSLRVLLLLVTISAAAGIVIQCLGW